MPAEWFEHIGYVVEGIGANLADDFSDYFHGRSRTAEDVANGLTDYAGRAGHSAGYGVGYGVGYALTGPGAFGTGPTGTRELMKESTAA